MNIKDLIRDNIRLLQPYSSAREEYSGDAQVFLDANENPFGNHNRYPDPNQARLKETIARIKNISTQNIFIGNGSDEVIDLLFRIFCRPGKDRVIICPPTYGMYEVCANVHDVKVKRVPLTDSFNLDIKALLYEFRKPAKLLFLCSPNNPTGNSIPLEQLEQIIKAFNGIVVLDEAYIDFAEQPSLLNRLKEFKNLVILQTLSKAKGLAAIRIGMAFANESIIFYLRKIKFPYNVSEVAQRIAVSNLSKPISSIKNVILLLSERTKLINALQELPVIEKVYPSDANFLLVKVGDVKQLYTFLANRGIIVRDRSTQHGCKNCLRITVGSAHQNRQLINDIKTFCLETIVD